jgi:1-acyl-sn-glycerol-3-phosphate acyltransferase
MIVTLLKMLLLIPFTAFMSIAAIIAAVVDRSGRIFNKVGRGWSKGMLWSFRVKVSVAGLDNIKKSERYVYVSNHASLFDIPAVLTSIPDEIRIIFKRELAYVPLWGWSLVLGHYITVDRSNPKDGMNSIERAIEEIRNGTSVLVFAEGTRSRDGKLQPFKRGAFALAARSGVPIVPITVNNSFRIMPKGSWRIQPAEISVVIDKPIQSAGVMGRDDELRLMEQVHAVLEKNFVEQ